MNVTFLSSILKGKWQGLPLLARHFWPLSSCHLSLHSSLMLLPHVSAALRTWRKEMMMHFKSTRISMTSMKKLTFTVLFLREFERLILRKGAAIQMHRVLLLMHLKNPLLLRILPGNIYENFKDVNSHKSNEIME